MSVSSLTDSGADSFHGSKDHAVFAELGIYDPRMQAGSSDTRLRETTNQGTGHHDLHGHTYVYAYSQPNTHARTHAYMQTQKKRSAALCFIFFFLKYSRQVQLAAVLTTHKQYNDYWLHTTHHCARQSSKNIAEAKTSAIDRSESVHFNEIRL